MYYGGLATICLLVGIVLPPACFGATVQLELVGDAQDAAMVFQQWGQLLSEAGIRNVRIRSANASDKLGIETRGTADQPVYVVTGVIRSRDELILPGARFHRKELDRLARWLAELAELGPHEGREAKSAFGLSKSQFDKVRDDLSVLVGSATQDQQAASVVRRICGKLKLSVELNADTERALEGFVVKDDLSELTCGTTLAAVLRSAGLGLLPCIRNGQPAYTVVEIQADSSVWPVGWSDEKAARETLPALYEFLNVNIQNVSAAQTLSVIGERLKAPILYDWRSLGRQDIDPTKAMVSLPPGKTTYSLALRKLLFQARMKFEVRCDEAGKPFLWVTSVKPAA